MQEREPRKNNQEFDRQSSSKGPPTAFALFPIQFRDICCLWHECQPFICMVVMTKASMSTGKASTSTTGRFRFMENGCVATFLEPVPQAQILSHMLDCLINPLHSGNESLTYHATELHFGTSVVLLQHFPAAARSQVVLHCSCYCVA